MFINLISYAVYSIKRRDFNTSDTKDNKIDDSIASTTTTFNTKKNMAAQNNSPKIPVEVEFGSNTQDYPTSFRSVNDFFLLIKT